VRGIFSQLPWGTLGDSVDLRCWLFAKEAAAKKGIKLPSRDKMLDELEALGREFKCGTYREWDSVDNLIKALRRAALDRVKRCNQWQTSNRSPAFSSLLS
jgi:hypothetical protein